MKAKDVQLIVYDFDGVMTDNTVFVDQHGRESVRVNRGDGLAVSLFKKMNIAQIIMSTEANDVVAVRGEKLKLPVIHHCRNKKRDLLSYCRKNKIDLKKVLYVGNDLNDLEAMQIAGLRACPADAHSSIKKIATIVTHAKGGEGVIRELVDILELNE